MSDSALLDEVSRSKHPKGLACRSRPWLQDGAAQALPHPQRALWVFHTQGEKGAVISGKSPGFDTCCRAIIIVFNYTTGPLPGRRA